MKTEAMPAGSLVIALFLLAAGCAPMRATDPFGREPQPPPDRGGAPAAPAAPASAAAAFAEAAPEVDPAAAEAAVAAAAWSEPLDLERAIEIALANNPDLAAAGWEAIAAAARRDHAAGERLPAVSLEGGYVRHLDEQRLLPVRRPGDPAILSRDIASGDIVLTVPIFTGGRIVNQIRAAELQYLAQTQRLARNRQELIFNVSSMYYGILVQGRVIESLRFSRRTLEEHTKRVEALIEARKAAEVDRLRTEVRLADIRQRLVREENLLSIQHRALANLMGIDGGPHPPQLRGDLAARGDEEVPALDAALAAAWSRRGDYLAARSALQAHARSVDAARAAHWPQVVLQGSYGERWAVGPTSGSGDLRDDIGRVGVAVRVPVFEGGRTRARIREQRALLAAAREDLRRRELAIRLEVETALLNVRSSRERGEALRRAVDQAAEGLRIERQKYELGRGAIVDVLDAQAALLEAESNYHRALADFHTAMAQLRLATGAE